MEDGKWRIENDRGYRDYKIKKMLKPVQHDRKMRIV